jgi:hypothetical protein
MNCMIKKAKLKAIREKSGFSQELMSEKMKSSINERNKS